MNTPANYERPLTELEKEILGYIREHPNLTAEDVANEYQNLEAAYDALAYLQVHRYVKTDMRTLALRASA